MAIPWRSFGGALSLAWSAAPVSLTLSAVLTAASGSVPVTAAWLTRLLLDGLTDTRVTGSATRLSLLAAGLAVTGLLSVSLSNATTYLSRQNQRAIALRAHDRLYRKVNTFGGLRRFEDPVFLDGLRIARQAGERGPTAIIDALTNLARTAVTTFGYVVAVMSINHVFAVVLLLTLIPMLTAELALARRRATTTHRVTADERREFFYSSLLSDVHAAKEIRLFGIGDLLHGRMRETRERVDAMRRRLDRRTLAVQGGLGLLAATTSGLGLVWTVSTTGSVLTVGAVSMFLAATTGVNSGLAGTATAVAMANQQVLEFRHYQAVLNGEPDLPAPVVPRALAPLRRGIEFRDVWFRYSDQHPWALRQVNLMIPNGKATALVGRNGSGKSTMVKLLCRFYDPDRGAILWDGIDIREVPVDELRTRLTAVFQDYVEYDMTATDNIGIGDIRHLQHQDRIEVAARHADIHETLSRLPHGYQTMLGRMFFTVGAEDAGVSLSGGQWQRVALARSYIRDDVELLILDEPSAGLDAESEHEIHRRMRTYRQGRTSLLISHRLGAVREADQIAVLDEGTVTELGTHNDLMRLSGRYARMFTLQAKSYADGRSTHEPVIGIATR